MRGIVVIALALAPALFAGAGAPRSAEKNPPAAAGKPPTVLPPFTAKAMGFDQLVKCWDWTHEGRVLPVIRTIEVTWVVRESQAFKAGMREGMQIVAVNGTEVRGALFDKYVHYFQVTPLKSVTFTVVDPGPRSSKPHDIVLERPGAGPNAASR